MHEPPYLYLISDGTVNETTKMMVIDGGADLREAVARFIKDTGTPANQVVVNPADMPANFSF